MAFVDLSKAFDTVNRDLLWAVPLRVAYPQRFVNILQSFHKGMMAQVTTGGQARPSKVYTGVRQGCVLAPVLFNIFLMSVTWLLHKEVEGITGVWWVTGWMGTYLTAGGSRSLLRSKL